MLEKVAETTNNIPQIISMIYSEVKEIKETVNVAEAQELMESKQWIVLSIGGTQENLIFSLGRIE